MTLWCVRDRCASPSASWLAGRAGSTQPAARRVGRGARGLGRWARARGAGPGALGEGRGRAPGCAPKHGSVYTERSSRMMICLEVGVCEPWAVESSGTSTFASGKYVAAQPRAVG
jgi:hypothetical protein